MKLLPVLFGAVCAWFIATGTADAAPVFGAVAKLVSLLGATSMGALSIGGGALGAAVGRIVGGLASSALSRFFRKDPPPRGVLRQVDLGADKPLRVLLGFYPTRGHLIWAGSHGAVGKTPRAYFTSVVQLSALPIDGIEGILVNGSRATLGATAHPDYGFPVTEYRVGGRDHLWLRIYDGTQTTPDPMLLAKYAAGSGTADDMPWSADMIGRGVAYAIITTLGNDQLWSGQVPDVLFEARGLKLYDRRLDGTRGGSGPQRLTDRATWTFSSNPLAAAETLLTAGFGFATEHLYGPRWPASMLPAANWLAALNACDVSTLDQAGNPQPMYRFGCDLDLRSPQRTTLLELLKCAAADFALCEGQALVHVGAASAPVASFTDADCSVSHPQELNAFRGLEDLFNAASATFPDPAQAWAMVPAPTPVNAVWEAEDGGRRSVDMPFPWVPWVEQVQRLVASTLADQRRQRVHRLVLKPRFAYLAPLDFVAWTSLRNGYAAKLFKVSAVRDLPTGHVEVVLTEQDPDDYDPPSLIAHNPAEPVVPAPVARQIAPGDWSVTTGAVADAGGADRRPALVLAWDEDTLSDAAAVEFEVQVSATAAPVFSGVVGVASGSAIVSAGVVPATLYRARLKPQIDGAAWSDWKSASSGSQYLTDADFEGGVRQLFVDLGLSAPEIVGALPASGNFAGRLVYLTTDGKLYRHAGTPGDATGFTASVPAADIQGVIAGTQIADDAITTPKLAAGAVVADKVASGAIVADKIAAGAILTDKIAAGAITSALLSAGVLITDSAQIADAIITNAKIAGSIRSTNYAEDGAGVPTAGFSLERDTGSIKGVNVIARNALNTGAATDFVTQTIPGDFNITDVGGAYDGNWYLAASIALGPTQIAQQWRLLVNIDRRSQSWANPAPPPPNLSATASLMVDWRVKVGGVWSGWVTLPGYDRTLFSPWDHFTLSETIGHVSDDMEVRVQLRVTGSDPSVNGVPRVNLFRNLSLTAQRLMK